MEKYAHKSEDGRWQTIADHLQGTAELAAENSVEFFRPYAHAVGYGHDIGKYAELFQERLRGSGVRFEHSVCGAFEYKAMFTTRLLKLFAPLMQYCIACHHTGLQDGGSLRMAEQSYEPTMNARCSERHRKEYVGKRDYRDYQREIELEVPDFEPLLRKLQECATPVDRVELYAFVTRYLFSCLTDADFIDTERFVNPSIDRGCPSDFEIPRRRLDEKLSGFPSLTELQKARTRLQDQAFRRAVEPSAIRILNMPTGSGKTLCSLKIALDRMAADPTKKRIVYVIPYTGIIEQTAAEFSPIFADAVTLLEHHSNYDFGDRGEDESTAEKLRRASENWDAPVVITTAVRFFESIVHYKSSALRKLHNLADSIIVLDEIHTLPLDCLQPCLRAIGYLTGYLNSEVILLSATMPDYTELFKAYAPGCPITHLIEDKTDFACFRKADFRNLGRISAESLIAKAEGYQSSLIVVNSRKSARKLYGMLQGTRYHLSNLMTPIDRRKTIAQIGRDLADGKKITVVSTSLIEAGIDLDFECVFRELCGLDSIIQAGGRCNREGRRPRGEVFVYEDIEDIEQSPPADAAERIGLTRELLGKYDDISDPRAINEYYRRIFRYDRATIAKNSIAGESTHPAEIPFRTFSEKFRLIKDETVGVVIEQDENCRSLLEKLTAGDRGVLRKLQKYTVSLKAVGVNSEFARARQSGIIEELPAGIWKLSRLELYSSDIGLDIDKNSDIFC